MKKILGARHGIVCKMPENDLFGYFGWPTVTKMGDGTIVVAASGLRHSHVCPWGKTILFTSKDNGETWSSPFVLNDTPLDDRDAGALAFDKDKLLVTWFTSDTRRLMKICQELSSLDCSAMVELWNEKTIEEWLGSFIRIKNSDGKWTDKIPVKVTAPHGPIQLKDGTLFYLGKTFGEYNESGKLVFNMDVFLKTCRIQALSSNDGGMTWKELGMLPGEPRVFCEPHALELDNGKIIGFLRREGKEFSIYQTESEDRGMTWSEPRLISYGSPPHLMMHSSGTIICSYGYRKEPYGQHVMFSRDEGKTWDIDWQLQECYDYDIGYPSTIELEDGSLLTVYYQMFKPKTAASLHFTKWRLPEF